MGKLITMFRTSFGCEHVFDASFSRDISLIESAKEFVTKKKNNSTPVLASSCPGWVCYAEKKHGEEVIPYMSTAKSPQQIMGSIVKKHLCKSLKISPENIYHVAIMPCFDKKLEVGYEWLTESKILYLGNQTRFL